MRARLRRRPVLYTLAVLAVVSAGAASAGYARLSGERVTAAAVAAAIAPLLAADSLAPSLHPGVHALYDARDGLPAWFAPEAREAALAVLASAPADALPAPAALPHLRARADTSELTASLAALDLALSDALLRHGDALGTPRADATALYGIWWTPSNGTPTDGAPSLADALALPDVAAGVAAWAEGRRPPHPGYRRLRDRLARELALADGTLFLDRDLAPGDSAAAVATLRDRLAVEGHVAESETPAVFDAGLADALRGAQRAQDLDATGRLDGATRRALNRHDSALIPLLTLNLEKWRWLPRDLGDLHLWVNVPRFELALRERRGDAWDEAIRFTTVVGASDWQTPAFTDTLETLVFNPTWIVPASIQRASYGYVRGFVERPPGPGNAMGRVKFLFPNDHAVYVHDTPTKWAFSIEDRARSHGCVRAGDPEGLARELLTRTNGWDPSEVADIFAGRWWPTRTVEVEGTVPVHLVYFTAEVHPDGRLLVHDDVYRRDARLAEALGVELPDLDPALVASLIADRIGDEEAVAAEAAEPDPATDTPEPAEPAAVTSELAEPVPVPVEPPPPTPGPAAQPVPGASLDSVGLATPAIEKPVDGDSLILIEVGQNDVRGDRARTPTVLSDRARR